MRVSLVHHCHGILTFPRVGTQQMLQTHGLGSLHWSILTSRAAFEISMILFLYGIVISDCQPRLMRIR